MKLEEVNQITKEAVDYLVQALESGQSAVLTQYLGAMAKFRNYSFGNITGSYSLTLEASGQVDLGFLRLDIRDLVIMKSRLRSLSESR